MLHLRQVGELLGPAAARGDPVELVELVAVAVGDEQDRAVVPDRDTAHRVLRERRQLVGPAAVDRADQRLNWPEMFEAKRTRSPSGVSSAIAWNRR